MPDCSTCYHRSVNKGPCASYNPVTCTKYEHGYVCPGGLWLKGYPHKIGYVLTQECYDCPPQFVCFRVGVLKGMFKLSEIMHLLTDQDKQFLGIHERGVKAVSKVMPNTEKIPDPSYKLVPIQLLHPNPNNPRKKFDQESLDKLTESIKQVGILEPILCVKNMLDEWGSFELRIVAGERRWRAALAAGLQEVPVIVQELTEEQEFEVMLTENIQRQDLDPIEEAIAFKAAIDRGWKQVDLAAKLGISQEFISNRMRLLKLPESVQENISRGILSAGHGLALLKVAHAEMLMDLVHEFVEGGIPVARAAEKVDSWITYTGRPLFRETYNPPLFNIQETCIKTKCKMLVHVKTCFDNKDQPYCIDPRCWDKNQIIAKQQQKEKKMQEILESSEISELLDLTVISNSDYRIFTDKVEECANCNFIKEGYTHYDCIVKVCTNPECYDEKAKAKSKEKAQKTRKQNKAFEERKKQILEMIGDEVPHEILLYIAARVITSPAYSYSWTRDKIIKHFYKQNGWELLDFKNYKDEIKDIIDHLSVLSEKELWQAILYGLLWGIDEDDYIYQLVLGSLPEPEKEHDLHDDMPLLPLLQFGDF